MLFSMTGYGDSRAEGQGFSVSIEARTVNNRHLKVTVRGTEPYPLYETEFEKVVRSQLRRGSILLQVRVEREKSVSGQKLNTATLGSYLDQVKDFCRNQGHLELVPALMSGALLLPGVAPESTSQGTLPEAEWPVIQECLLAALKKVNKVRQEEGAAMANGLLQLQSTLQDELAEVQKLLPKVGEEYRNRILERVRQAVQDAQVSIESDHLIREVAIFADRSDVSEEVTRFQAHLQQFTEIINAEGDGAGRRLEFVVQEMGREVNTLGSKCSDISISRRVVEMKATLEKVREIIQNVE